VQQGTISLLVFLAVFSLLVGYVRRNGNPEKLELRPIPALKAIEECIGRATELGRPAHFTLGGGQMNASVLAAFEILGYASRLAVRNDADMIVTTCYADEHPVAEEIVRTQFLDAGKVDKFDPRRIIFLSGDKEAYQAGVIAIMEKERVACNFLIGNFLSDALTLAEAGHLVGAVQIGGTADTMQLPFFVATCDYVLIGEELFAGSFYISKDIGKMGTFVAQEVSKCLVLVLIIVGSLFSTFGNNFLANLIAK